MAKTKTEWPRLALFEEAERPFGLYRKTAKSDIQIAFNNGDGPEFIGRLKPEELRPFCEIFGLDCPYESLVNGKDQ